MQRHEWIDFAKGVSIFLVVMFHASISCEYYNLTADSYWLANDFLAPIRMPVFFAISGFLARDVIKSSYSNLFDRRIIQLLYIFVVWSVIALAFDFRSYDDPSSVLLSAIQIFYEPSSVLWFVWALSIYMTIAALGSQRAETLVLVLSAIVSALSYARTFHFDLYVHNNLFRLLPFFLFGAYRGEWLVSIPQLVRPKLGLAIFLTFAAGFVVLRKDLLPPFWDYGGRFAMAAMGVVIGAILSVYMCRWKYVKAIPLYLGRHTLPIYVAHSLVVGAMASWLSQFARSLPGISLWAVPVVSVGAIAVSLLIKVASDKIGLQWLYRRPVWLSTNSTKVNLRA